MTLLCSPDTTINKACGHLLFTRFNIVILLSWHRSEGPAQVFLLILTWLVAAFGHKTREDWKLPPRDTPLLFLHV